MVWSNIIETLRIFSEKDSLDIVVFETSFLDPIVAVNPERYYSLFILNCLMLGSCFSPPRTHDHPSLWSMGNTLNNRDGFKQIRNHFHTELVCGRGYILNLPTNIFLHFPVRVFSPCLPPRLFLVCFIFQRLVSWSDTFQQEVATKSAKAEYPRCLHASGHHNHCLNIFHPGSFSCSKDL